MSRRGGDLDSPIGQNRLAYQRIAAVWDERRQTSYDDDFHERCRARFLEHLQGQRVLDVGCGLGLDSHAFAVAGLRVVASDIVSEFLRMIRRRTPEIPVVAMDMTASCFRAGSFDGIYACASFLHVPAALAPATLAGFASMLAPGGVLFLHHVASSRGLSSYSVDDLLIQDNPALCYCRTPRSLAALLRTAGLRVSTVSWLRPQTFPSPCAARNHLVPYQLAARK